MVPYTGKNSSKQTIRTKSIRFGYKNFVLSSDDGYPYFLDSYCGAKYGGGKVSKNLCALSVLDSDLPHTTVKHWNPSEKFYINIDRPNCITVYNKHMGGVDLLDAHFSVYHIDVRGKKWYWPHYINTLDVLKSADFEVFRLTYPGDKMDFLVFTCRIIMHYLKSAKVQRQLPPNIIYPRKRSWKGNAVNERKEGHHVIEKTSQKRCRFVQTDQEHGARYVRLDFVWNHALKPFIRTELR